jgi:dihydroorotate dehydrogenase electron transfer subunit
MLQLAAELVERRAYGASQELRLHAPELARRLSPGQPVLVRAGLGLSPYLRRTFFPIALDAETFTIRVPPSGDWGHAWLRAAPAGSRLDCLGPVGNGYQLRPGIRNVLCLGQGEAIWNLLAAVIEAEANEMAVMLASEVTGKRDGIPAGRLPEGVEYRVASRASDFAASSAAMREPKSGKLTAAGLERAATPGSERGLDSWLPDLLPWADLVLAAGSLEFYAALSEAVSRSRFGLSRGFVQALYPASFLCGTGACQSCVADVARGRRRVCLRGPVFDLVDIQP